jgi:hypothetical protein
MNAANVATRLTQCGPAQLFREVASGRGQVKSGSDCPTEEPGSNQASVIIAFDSKPSMV